MLKEVSCLCGKTSGVAEFQRHSLTPESDCTYFLHHFEYLSGNFGMTTRDDGRWDILCGICYTPLREVQTSSVLEKDLRAIPSAAEISLLELTTSAK